MVVLVTSNRQNTTYAFLCNVFVNHVCLHALFLDVICVTSVLKALQVLCCMLLHVPTLNNVQQNKTF